MKSEILRLMLKIEVTNVMSISKLSQFTVDNEEMKMLDNFIFLSQEC